jgi:hypothetical protein
VQGRAAVAQLLAWTRGSSLSRARRRVRERKREERAAATGGSLLSGGGMRQGRGGCQLGAAWGWEEWRDGAGVRHRVSQHGTGVVALGHSDSGGRRTSRGHGRRAVNRGGGRHERRGRSG